MSERARASSNRKLLLFFGVVVLTPLLFVFGPFRDRFFPKETRALQNLARTIRPEVDVAALAAGGAFAAERVAELARHWEAGRYDAVHQILGELPAGRIPVGLQYLHGVAALLLERPAAALRGLEAAVRADDPRLRMEARFLRAQALLLLGQRAPARADLAEVAGSGGAYAGQAAEQLRQLDALP